jgi:serine protease
MGDRSTPAAHARPGAGRIGAALLCGLLFAAAALQSARAETVFRIRVRLNPEMVAAGPVAPAQLARLETLAGTKLTQVSLTRTGAIEFALGDPSDSAALKPKLQAMRQERSVLWAEPATPGVLKRATTRSAAASGHGYVDTGHKLMVRLAGDPSPDWATLLPRFSEQVGVPVAAERRIGNVWVLGLMQTVGTDVLAGMASRLEADPAVQYADPVLRRYPRFVPNDPLFPQQWALTDPVGGINVETAWDLQLQSGAASTTIALIDTGILQHPDLQFRLLPGYDFISDPSLARDGDARDANPRDEGDWRDEGSCGGFPASSSTWHGTFVSGIMAGDINNGVGMAGIDLFARVLPVRVLGECGGTDEDVFEGMLWASGVQIAGVPPNPFPAKVINMSLGGFGSCPNAVQDAIDDALAQGAIVVVAAGNESSNTSDFAPSGCSGVITVGATNRAGDIASYSNFGQRIDISAPGGDFDDGGFGVSENGAILSLSNDGQTAPGGDAYAIEIGTSAAAPQVSGVVSMMLARNPTLTAGSVLAILQGTARAFPTGSICSNGNACGAGILDAGLAMASTIPGGAVPPLGAAKVVEYYRDDLDHYYYTADPGEIGFFDTSPLAKNKRTGLFFFAWTDPSLAPPGARPVCKFVGSAALLIQSNYYSSVPEECAFVQANWPGVWTLVNPAVFWVLPADTNGACADGTIPVFRFSNNRKDFNQRHTLDLSVKRAMINRAWVPDGGGPNGTAFCSPI